MSLEGKELEGQLGTNGSYSLDVDTSGKVVITVSYMLAGALKASMLVEADVMDILQSLADKTSTTFDNRALDMIKLAIGR